MSSPATARRLWALGEPLHALTYFAAECRTAAEEAGLPGFWAGYFAQRAAPLGAVGAEVVTASFYNFAPAFVARWVPGVWSQGAAGRRADRPPGGGRRRRPASVGLLGPLHRGG